MMETEHSYFIPSKNLGVLESQLRSILLDITNDKRKRVRECNRLSKVIHDLRLVPREEMIKSLSLGVRVDGETGLFVFVVPTTRISGDIPQ